MYKILKAEKLAEKIFLMDVEAPRVARSCQPGEFVIVKMDEKGERVCKGRYRGSKGPQVLICSRRRWYCTGLSAG